MANVPNAKPSSFTYRATLAIIGATTIAMLSFIAGRASAAHESTCVPAGAESAPRANGAVLDLDFSPSPAESGAGGAPIDPPSPYGFNQPG